MNPGTAVKDNTHSVVKAMILREAREWTACVVRALFGTSIKSINDGMMPTILGCFNNAHLVDINYPERVIGTRWLRQCYKGPLAAVTMFHLACGEPVPNQRDIEVWSRH